jgi:hypothetical protein
VCVLRGYRNKDFNAVVAMEEERSKVVKMNRIK